VEVGTVVRWIGESDDYGSVGIVSECCGNIFWVTWADGEVVDYVCGNTHAKRIVILCK
jgi:hypothetical protein